MLVTLICIEFNALKYKSGRCVHTGRWYTHSIVCGTQMKLYEENCRCHSSVKICVTLRMTRSLGSCVGHCLPRYCVLHISSHLHELTSLNAPVVHRYIYITFIGNPRGSSACWDWPEEYCFYLIFRFVLIQFKHYTPIQL